MFFRQKMFDRLPYSNKFEMLRYIINVLNFRLSGEERSYEALEKQLKESKGQMDDNDIKLNQELNKVKNGSNLKDWQLIFKYTDEFDKIDDINFFLYLRTLNLFLSICEKQKLIYKDLILNGLALMANVLLYFSLDAFPDNRIWALEMVLEIQNALFESYGSLEKIQFLSNLNVYENFLNSDEEGISSEDRVELLEIFSGVFNCMAKSDFRHSLQ